MTPTRKRDLATVVVMAALVGYLLVLSLYRWFPPLTVWTGLSLAAVAVVEAIWGGYVRAKINAGEIGVGGGRLHPIAVARSVVIAQASAWVGVASADSAGAAVAAACAVALLVAALWLQHCCKSPQDPSDNPDATPE